MASELTVDNLLKSIREALEAGVPDGCKQLTLHGVPMDDVMRDIMQACGGRLTIVVNELPAEVEQLVQHELQAQGKVAAQGCPQETYFTPG